MTQAISLARELSVLPPEPCDRLGQVLILASDPGGLQEAPLAGNGVGQEDGGYQGQQESRQAAPDRWAGARAHLLCAAPNRGTQGQGPLDLDWPSCGGRDERFRPGASAWERHAWGARHASPVSVESVFEISEETAV